MKFKILSVILFFSYISILSPAGSGDTNTIATVGNHNISITDFADRYSKYLLSTGIKDNMLVRKSILNNMISEILLLNYDSNDKIFSDPAYLIELEETRVRLILAYLKDQEVYARITVTEEEMREAFLRVNEQIAARHLYAPTEEEAYKLYELLKIGVPFETLAAGVFTDSVLKNNGGYLGYFTWGDMDPAFEEAAYSLNPGEISPPVKTSHGYSIIRLEDRLRKPIITEYEFQSKKSHLEKVLKIRKKFSSERDYIYSVFNKDRLSYNEKSLKDIFDGFNRKDQPESGDEKSLYDECLTYNGRKYSRYEIERKIAGLPDYHKSRIKSVEMLKAAVEGLLIKDILYNIAVSKGYDTAKAVTDMFESYKKNIFLKYKIDEITRGNTLPDSVLIDYYRRNIHLFSYESELNLQEILVDDKQLADSLFKLISEGADFGMLAKKFSLRKWSAENDGIMGYAPVSKFGSYKELFLGAEPGEILGPVKIENLFGIFRVLGRNEGRPVDFDLVKDEVIKAAQFENQSEVVRDYLDLLRKKADVKINDNLLGSYNIAG